MRWCLLVFTALLTVPVTPALAAQTVSLGALAGTLGIGPDVSVSRDGRFLIRGSASLLALDADLTPLSGLGDNLTARFKLPKAFYTVGVALEHGMFRVGAGVLYKHKDPRIVLALEDGASVDIGQARYTVLEISGLTATLRSDAWAPYVLAGLGKHNARGLDIFLDVGVAFLSGEELVLAATGESDLLRSRLFRNNLEVERLRFRRELGSLLTRWPILNFGIRYGFGS